MRLTIILNNLYKNHSTPIKLEIKCSNIFVAGGANQIASLGTARARVATPQIAQSHEDLKDTKSSAWTSLIFDIT